MDRKHKLYLKLNVMTLFFIAISCISVTLAWFAYSGIAKVSTDIDVKSWLIEFEKNDTTVSNNIVISLDDIYPGMEVMHETIKIKNKGDSNAKLSYSIVSARVFDEEIIAENVEQDFVKDRLSHYYPFSINMDLSDNFVLSKEEDSQFELSISWPLDSQNDERDSEWGNLAYQFGNNEQEKLKNDPTYQIRPSIKIVISAKAEQMTEFDDSSDINYPLGKQILYDISENKRCTQLSDTCISTYVIDINNKIGDETVTLLPDLFGSYSSGPYTKYNEILAETKKEWKVKTEELKIDDILKIISKDINNTLIIRNGFSDAIIGYLNSEESIDNLINKTIPKDYNGYYSFLNKEYSYLVTNKCYWFNKEYDNTRNLAFALTKNTEENSKIYGEIKNGECSVIPKIIAPKKPNLNTIEEN